MAAMLETPSRVWRRIEAIEDRDMPSLPSLPPFEDSAEEYSEHDGLDDLSDISSPLQSTPAAASMHNTAASTIRPTSSTSSTARFASSIASRSTKSSILSSSRGISARRNQPDSFDISIIPSLPNITAEPGTENSSSHEIDEEVSKDSVPEIYLPPEIDYNGRDGDEDFSLAEALQSISHTDSPHTKGSFTDSTPKKNYDYSPSPYDKYRNVALRKAATRTRTPSLSRTTSSRASSPAHSTPQSSRSIVLPRSNAGSPLSSISISLPRSRTGSPASVVSRSENGRNSPESDQDVSVNDTGIRSMEITDVHISPPQPGNRTQSEAEESQSDDDRVVNNDKTESQDEREPTFSSDGGGPTPYVQRIEGSRGSHQSPGGFSAAFSSPTQSVAFTPTPAFPRPRARFNLSTPNEAPETPAQHQVQENESESEGGDGNQPTTEVEEPLTPHTRRRSFLLSVINSTTRPRLKFPTPHPRHFQNLATPSIAESPHDPEPNSIQRTNLQTAFAGVTPRPRVGAGRGPRVSHPLAQATLPSPGTSDSESVSPASGVISRRASLGQWAPQTQALSPYDGAVDRASFISTASSHDLTTHHRANTSFDPAMGFGAGAPGQGVGRFNAGKLNNYLHGLNRRLQEENEALVERLQKLEEERKSGPVALLAIDEGETDEETGRRLSGGGRRRISIGGGTLGNVKEDVGGEGWMEEKAELEDMADALKEEVAKYADEKEELERALNDEREERTRDKERWRERMVEVEQGVEVIIKELEKKAEVAEKNVKDAEHHGYERVKELEKVVVEIEGERDAAMERAEKAEQVLESGKELGGELREANERIGNVMGDLRNANAQIKELEEEILRSDGRIDDLEKDLQEHRDLITALEEEIGVKSDELATDRATIRQLEETVQQTVQELEEAKNYAAELEDGAGSAIERIENLEDELAVTNQRVKDIAISEEQTQERAEKLEADAHKARELARQMEDALEDAETKMLADEEALTELKNKIASLERERQREANMTQESSRNPFAETGPTEAELEALESELDNANKEIAKLTTLLNQSPARKAMDKAKDTKIEVLEREKEELLERNKALRMTVNEIGTPHKVINASGISPIHRQVLSMSIRAPRTPGAPLKDISWLNNTSADPTVSPLIAEINRLQRELDLANDSIDDKLDKLEDAGLGVVGLTQKLEDARAKISALEDEIARLSRKEERRLHRLERARCKKCHTKVDFAALAQADESSLEISRDYLPTEPPTPPTKTSEALQANLRNVNSQLEVMKKEWADERRQLVGEKAVLQDAANKLNVQIRNVKEEVRKVTENERAGEQTRAGIQGELDKAKKAIADLEANLKTERAQLRALTTEQNRIQREKENDINDVKHQLHKYKQENHDLETELRENANVEQKARLLEIRVAENNDTIDQLRQERGLLATDHKELQRRFSEISEQANQLRHEYAVSSTSHDNRRHQLDLHLLEIDDLRRALSDSAEELERAEMEKDRISAEKNDVARTVSILESDLRRVKKDAEAFGRDLKLLRIEKEKLEIKHKDELSRLERSKKQTQTQIRLLNEQMETQRAKTGRARDELKSHVCAADEQRLSAIKVQHNKECKGLIVQIKYLKAKFTRESSLRCDLGYQKQYLLVLLSRFEKSEQTIFASIARIGFPVPLPSPPEKQKRLKSAALAVIFLSRARRASNLWREQSSSKQAVAAALEDVRRRRAMVTASMT
ncbi:hypothetical protein BDZ94DRAFT_1341734 [Collybia nuda]|uniref:Pericentrin/AKAP-450 centrosomal targeting domain-containing protein n=1 Tax=Collybia nuda TaxID=64659 RepID=A0A9P6CMX8_9AGAR|nr:hypothetical protein BDZ94DRAFT_1341734 [Collybia nuda]